MKTYELSEAAVRALKEMQEDYGFTDGPQLPDDVLEVLGQLSELDPDQRALARELRSIPLVGRASISRAIRARGRDHQTRRTGGAP